WCLAHEKITAADLSCVAFYDKPFIKFERILDTYLAYAPRGIRSFLMAMPLWLKDKIWIPQLIRSELGYEGTLLFPEHHMSHAASAFYPSPFASAAFLTMDGVGEWTTTSYGTGSGAALEILGEQRFPHSLGLLYSAFTYFTGFKVNSAEYKVMGLAPYGEPVFVRAIYDALIDLKADGSFKMNMEYFDYCAGLKMTGAKFDRLFGGRPRDPESPLTRREMDLACSLQEVTGEIMLRQARHVHEETGEENLVLAGGVALNCVGNGRILREGPFREIWIQPASGDAGGALGAALCAWYGYYGNPRSAGISKDAQQGSFLGPSYDDGAIESVLRNLRAVYRTLPREALIDEVAELIDSGKVIGWFQGRMEFGPRALGARSIIGDARSPTMQSLMNLKIKFRESFRPFAPAVLKDHAGEYFDIAKESPYMLLVAPVAQEKRRSMTPAQEQLFGIDKLNIPRSDIPAVTHIDYTARIQTVSRDDHPLYYDLIERFYRNTGCPVIINTSFNVRGEPIVCTPEEAWRCFMRTEMDYLVMGSFILAKHEQTPLPADTDWKKEFALD
ncbi:MAG TPA: carbamoyltransferase N-terminal domain-containing protein, partial [Bacteroidota bacterium]|nr:carbamoyltransferase N-terminal domain-containing protein [Bacteroidota bacterium]